MNINIPALKSGLHDIRCIAQMLLVSLLATCLNFAIALLILLPPAAFATYMTCRSGPSIGGLAWLFVVTPILMAVVFERCILKASWIQRVTYRFMDWGWPEAD